MKSVVLHVYTSQRGTQAPTNRFMRLEAKPQANFTALVGICLKKITEETGVLQKWKQRRETDTAKEKWRERVKQQDIRQR